jgi:hypothetical protein
MFLPLQQKHAWYVGWNKGELQVAPRRKVSYYDPSRIQELENLGFDGTASTAWEESLSELADYCKITALQCS